MASKLLDAPALPTSQANKSIPRRPCLVPSRAAGESSLGIEMANADVSASLGRLDDAAAEIVSLIGYRERG